MQIIVGIAAWLIAWYCYRNFDSIFSFVEKHKVVLPFAAVIAIAVIGSGMLLGFIIIQSAFDGIYQFIARRDKWEGSAIITCWAFLYYFILLNVKNRTGK